MHRVPLAQREYLVVRVVGKTPRPAETTTRHCQPGGEGHTFGADSESEFLGLQLWASTPVASPAALRHHPRQEPRALTRMRGSVRGDWRKPVPYRDGAGHAKSPKKEVRSNPSIQKNIILSTVYSVDCRGFWGLFGLILVGLRWRDAGIRAGLFGLLFEEDSSQDCHQVAQAGKNFIGFFCDLALFSQRDDVSLVGIELIA